MTVHSAKGLEFRAVFLTGMEEEIFPYRGVSGREPEELDEERRLAYVAITRARERLVITHASMRSLFGTTRWLEPSRFLGDIPEDVVKHEGADDGAPRVDDDDAAELVDAADAPGDRPADAPGARSRHPRRRARRGAAVATTRAAFARETACAIGATAAAWSKRSKAAPRRSSSRDSARTARAASFRAISSELEVRCREKCPT